LIVAFLFAADSARFAIHWLFFAPCPVLQLDLFTFALDGFGNFDWRPGVASPNPFERSIAIDQGGGEPM
jgi:hypothetical protein